MHKLLSLGMFLLLVLVAVVAGGQFTGGDWYLYLLQPVWNPPALLMAAVWAVIYVLMAVSAWMVWEARRGLAIAALGWWGLQLLLIVCWSWMYFGLHRPGWAMGIMSLWLLVAVIVFRTFRAITAEAASLTLPVLAWLVFCWLLYLVQWNLNGGGLSSLFN